MGKTVFAKGVAEGLGVDPDEVGSPTFVLVSPHEGRLRLYHVDLYRIERQEEMFELGLEDCLSADSVIVVEWGENGRPTAVWDESGNVVNYSYDGCSRLTGIADATGRSLAIAYDENGNVTELVSSGADDRCASARSRWPIRTAGSSRTER